ncbi:hypothetical protein KDW_38890 [Dictyobacter vulcani]|uniref:GIY-YIG domain-containing protein n=1 Tax=Dictyobacter vulcani TaxID=2607529 RepID=A0A5J4KTH8_9CHLR|nr:SAV_2336 N-terminal domain-related protein [Dictyobacter vulcani]GER89727.1 hypothetical protein KDW_38890 [Dictyobacter vulcani]
MLSKLITALHHADLDMTAEEIADALWLASHMDAQEILPASNSQPSNVNEDAASDQTDPSLSPARPVQKTTADVHLHAQNSHASTTSYATSRPFRSPAAPALPNALALARALRPLMQRIPSKTAVVFNEHATAQRIAETGAHVWLPIFEPAPIRWFDVELVIDIGASMSLWQETIAELRALLEHIGAFRNVRTWRLATDNADRIEIYAGMAQKQTVARNSREIIHPGGNSLILVATDCISPAWHSGKVQDLLNIWGQKNLVTLIQMLPRRLWSQTALENADLVQIYSSQPEASNKGLKIKKTFSWSDEGTPTKQLLPLPTLTLETGVLSPWAQIVTGIKKTWITGTLFEHALTDMIQKEEIPSSLAENEILSPKKRVQVFRASASSQARKLAGLLAAVPIPISLPVIRQVQSTMLPEANQVTVAEVFLGGLLEEIYHDETNQNPDQVQYDFIAGVRDELINTVPTPDAHRVLREISQFVHDRYGQPRDFLAFIAIPHREADSDASSTQGSHPFAHLELRALRRFGGAFDEFVDEMERYLKLMSEQRNEHPENADSHQTILESPKEYSTNLAHPVSPTPSFMDETWCDFSWGPWLPLNSPDIPTDPGIYRVKATLGNELFFIGSTGRSLKGRIGDLYRNVMRDAKQMPFNDPHTAAPALWAWREETGVDFACSAITLPTQENLQILVHYFLWQYRLEKGSSTVANHGRFPAHYVKSKDRKTGMRGYRLPEDQVNPAGGPSFPPLPLLPPR